MLVGLNGHSVYSWLKLMKVINIRPFIIQVLRSASVRWPSRNEALKRARKSRGVYECAECAGLFKKKQISLDHVSPVIETAIGWVNFDTFIHRLFCEPEGFQVLCDSCHSIKTEMENELRKFHKRFVPVIGHEEMYFVNKKGVLKKGAKKTKKKVEPRQAEDGRWYHVIENETFYTDELIMKHFTDDWVEGCRVVHKNFNTSDDLFSNLEVVIDQVVMEE